jgi:orotidine-5'-phosphate decarboxylase
VSETHGGVRLRTELILALDLPDEVTALRLLDRLPDVGWVKVGSVLFVKEGPDLVVRLVERGLSVFLDLKWHDIPNTVRGAVASARDLGARMATVHTLGGMEMMTAAAESAGRDMDIIGVTVLTSHTPASFCQATGRPEVDLATDAIRLGRNALQAGLAGVVCSPREAQPLRQELGTTPLIVVPGIRRGQDPGDDQSRTATPKEAARAGATHLVIGRPVLNAKDPAQVWAEMTTDVQ